MTTDVNQGGRRVILRANRHHDNADADSRQLAILAPNQHLESLRRVALVRLLRGVDLGQRGRATSTRS